MSSDTRIKLLKNRSFLAYASSCFLATVGSGLTYVTLSWLILNLHNTLSATGWMMLCFWAPTVLLGPITGVWADKFSRKMMMQLSTGTRGVLLLLFGFTAWGTQSIEGIYILMILSGIFFSAYMPAAMGFVREFVAPEDLLTANATVDIAYELGNVIGMGTAGILVAILPPQDALILNGVIFLLSILALSFVKKPTTAPKKVASTHTTGLYQDFKACLVYLNQHKQLRLIYTIQLLLFVCFMITPVIISPFAKNVLHATVGQFGAIETALSAGVIIGGLMVPTLNSAYGQKKSLLGLSALLILSFALFAINRQIHGAIILYFLMGFAFSSWPFVITQAQDMTALHFQSRVQSVFNSLSGILILIVYGLVSWIGDSFSYATYYWLEAIIAAITLYTVWKFFRGFRKVSLFSKDTKTTIIERKTAPRGEESF